MKINKLLNRKIDGYMVIEASFIVPWVFMIFVLTIYFTFYLYNTCVVFQDCYISALRGSQIKSADTGYINNYVKEQVSKLLENQLYEYVNESEVDVGVAKISVDAKSRINIRQGELMLYRNRLLDIDQEAVAYRFNPVYLIRLAKR